VPAFALDSFERQAEAFLRARAWREWNFLSGQRPGRGLITLYDQDFPNFTSTDFWADLQAVATEEQHHHQALSSLLAAAYLEGRTRDFAVKVAGVQARAQLLVGAPATDLGGPAARELQGRPAPGAAQVEHLHAGR